MEWLLFVFFALQYIRMLARDAEIANALEPQRSGGHRECLGKPLCVRRSSMVLSSLTFGCGSAALDSLVVSAATFELNNAALPQPAANVKLRA